MNFISLFSGIGGIDLGLERAGMVCAAQVEIDEFCCRVLAKHWPTVPRFRDVKDYRPTEGAADVVAGGFPCQPFSLAGKRGGRQDERALWPHFARIIDAVRPTWVVAENVPGLRTLGADEVLEDLETLGYACWPLVVGADDVGAPHRRKRVFIVAHASGKGTGNIGGTTDGRRGGKVLRQGNGPTSASGIVAASDVPDALGVGRSRQGQRRDAEVTGLGSDRAERGVVAAGNMADAANKPGWWRHDEAGQPDAAGNGEKLADAARNGQREERAIGQRIGVYRWPARPGEPQHEWEQPRLARVADAESESPRSARQPREGTDSGSTQFAVGGAANGLPRRLARWRRAALKALGNSVVPQVAEAIGRAIMQAEVEVAA